MIRKADYQDIDSVASIYQRILSMDTDIGWLPNVYPVRSTALEALDRGELYVYQTQSTMEKNKEILAAMILNQTQVDAYAQGSWHYPARDSEVMVMHTLVVDPSHFGKGIATEMVAFYESFASEHDCSVLRIDTNAINKPARAMYRKLGYQEAGIVPCIFNGIPGVNLVLLEKKTPGLL